METTRNNRSIGEPLPAEQKRGKRRVKKGKVFCKVLRAPHDFSRKQIDKLFSGNIALERDYCVGCHKQGGYILRRLVTEP